MAAKLRPALYYTLAAVWPGHQVMAVTREKISQVFGRYVRDNSPTHRRRLDCIGRFETLEAAQAKLDAILELKKEQARRRAPLQEELRKLSNTEAKELDELLRMEKRP